MKTAGEQVVSFWVCQVVVVRSMLKMWRVKKVNLSLSLSPQPVSGRASGKETAGSSLGAVGVWGVLLALTHRRYWGRCLLLPFELLKAGGKGWGLVEPRLPHTVFFHSQGKPAIRTPLRELNLHPGALTSSGKGPPMGHSLTPSLCKLELQVRFA